MLWLIYAIEDFVANIIAYITNPIVCLFANEVGELPYFFRFWQTFDNPLDIEWMITENIVPKAFQYDFNKHYRYTDEWEAEKITGKHKGYVTLLDPTFTLKERIQRYFCRLCWMYRNTAYGFSYYITGHYIVGSKMKVVKTDSDKDWFSYDETESILDRTWSLYYFKPWCSRFKIRIYLGWKAKGMKPNEARHCMLAFFINPFRANK